SLVGWSGSGKTTVITRLISFFKAKKKTVVALKNVPHEYALQPEGKDSFKFLEAGADRVVLNSREEIILMKRKKDQEDILGMIQSALDNVDMVFLEGLLLKNVPVIEVLDSNQAKGFKYPLEKCSAIVSDGNIHASIPWFHKDDISAIAQFMEAYDE
ncbi:MAG: molybdopterin-guanine dinucleotide biosynthesis protein B, partial [Candidatus Aminicenantes bacterium]|nr:molybdopterin-guanine dinucleotide biosynthesis protein B [Candidatus Aminicenantes bacterium]